MKQIRGLDKWLTDDWNQHLWISIELENSPHEALLGNSSADIPMPYTREKILFTLKTISINDLGRVYISELRKRWSREKFNNNKNNKSTSITLSPSSLKQLDYLAKGKTRRQVLEELLAHGADFNKELAKQYNDLLKDNRSQFSHTESLFKVRQKTLEATVKQKNDEIKKLREEVKSLTTQGLSKYIR